MGSLYNVQIIKPKKTISLKIVSYNLKKISVKLCKYNLTGLPHGQEKSGKTKKNDKSQENIFF